MPEYHHAIANAFNNNKANEIGSLLQQIPKERIDSPIQIRNYVANSIYPVYITMSPLIFAICIDSLEAVQTIVDKGADVNKEEIEGDYIGFTPLLMALDQRPSLNPEIVNLLLEKGADIKKTVNVGGNTGFTALYGAATSGDIGLVKLLLEKGASFEIMSTDPFTVNNAILECLENNVAMAKLLIENVPNLNFAPEASLVNQTIFLKAIANNDEALVVKLIQKNADVNVRIEIPEDNSEITPLECAVGTRNFNMMKLLIDAGADVKKNNAIILAAHAGDMAMLGLLINSGADVNHCINDGGYTALIAAAEAGRLDVIEFLLKNGANLSIKNEEGKTALMVATDKGHQACASYLENVSKRLDTSMSTYLLHKKLQKEMKIDAAGPFSKVGDMLEDKSVIIPSKKKPPQ